MTVTAATADHCEWQAMILKTAAVCTEQADKGVHSLLTTLHQPAVSGSLTFWITLD